MYRGTQQQEEPVMFVNHATEQEEQDVSFEQSGWASTQSSNRWTTKKMEVSLITKTMRAAFSKARSRLDLRHRHASTGNYLAKVEKTSAQETTTAPKIPTHAGPSGVIQTN